MWVTNNLGYDVELSGVHLYRASQQEVTEAQATALLANATYVLLKTNGQLVQTDNQPDANAQYYVRPLDGVITLNGFPSNPNGSPEVSPLEAFDIGKEEGGEADLEDNKNATIDVSTYTVPVEITPTSGKDGMKKATITLDNIPSEADIEANKEATINVSTYTSPVEITPTQGKDGMAKTTVTLSNIPSGSSDVPSFMQLSTSDDDAIMLFGDRDKLTRLFVCDVEYISGWLSGDAISSIPNGDNGLTLGGNNSLARNLSALCVEYDNKMYKALDVQMPSYFYKYNFVEVQSQATPPTSDTPSGTVASGTTIHLSTTEAGGTIYCSIGDSAFEVYNSNGIEITSSTTIKAVVAVDGKFTSEYLELTYTVA